LAYLPGSSPGFADATTFDLFTMHALMGHVC
jgi:hypothetical protein